MAIYKSEVQGLSYKFTFTGAYLQIVNKAYHSQDNGYQSITKISNYSFRKNSSFSRKSVFKQNDDACIA